MWGINGLPLFEEIWGGGAWAKIRVVGCLEFRSLGCPVTKA